MTFCNFVNLCKFGFKFASFYHISNIFLQPRVPSLCLHFFPLIHQFMLKLKCFCSRSMWNLAIKSKMQPCKTLRLCFYWTPTSSNFSKLKKKKLQEDVVLLDFYPVLQGMLMTHRNKSLPEA